MKRSDAARLNDISAANQVPAATRESHMAPGSALRIESAVEMLNSHAVRFNVDPKGPDAEGVDFEDYAASLVSDLLVVAEKMGPGGAATVLARAALLTEAAVGAPLH